jgi:hypothetical protein
MRMNRKQALGVGAVMAVAFLAACSDSPTAPAASKAAFVPKSSFAVNDLTNNTPVVGVLKICKLGNVGGTFVVTDIGNGTGGTGTPSIQSPITVANGTCRIAVEDNGDANLFKGDFFSVSENAAADPANTVQALTSCAGVEGAIACNNNYFVNNVHGVVLTYTNTFTPPPPGDQGCTPGYWKQDQHFDSWPAGITPSTTFTSIFGVGGTLTFLEALGLNGGGTDALWRHGAAAYLNALSSGVDYAYTTAQVIDIVQGDGAYAGLSVEERKDLLDAANNGVGGCPLN